VSRSEKMHKRERSELGKTREKGTTARFLRRHSQARGENRWGKTHKSRSRRSTRGQITHQRRRESEAATMVVTESSPPTVVTVAKEGGRALNLGLRRDPQHGEGKRTRR